MQMLQQPGDLDLRKHQGAPVRAMPEEMMGCR